METVYLNCCFTLSLFYSAPTSSSPHDPHRPTAFSTGPLVNIYRLWYSARIEIWSEGVAWDDEEEEVKLEENSHKIETKFGLWNKF